ncbi:MAG TPA: prepilin-type N-terminal cleavage/methylation domain-containing protein [Candidatus Acidoferrales bacterium]|nr:prepilin-type N-terminal cleavage/methylation domain-containing protein [Candidatus Acidoferrales bacterium]
MIRSAIHRSQRGFSLIEMMTALVIFLLISAVAFSLLGVAQKRYATESEVLNAFQEARLGLDQIVRDVNDAGYPPLTQFASNPNVPSPVLYAVEPFAWEPDYPSTPCQIGQNCTTTPGDFDLVIETQVGQNCPSGTSFGVSFIRYQLRADNTLYRGVECKTAGGDPDSVVTAAKMVPYVQNVMNNAPAAQITNFRTYYPSMFPGAAPVPIFKYTCDTNIGPQDCAALGASPENSVSRIRSVSVTLIVMAPLPDSQTGAPRLVELNGLGRRINPNQ